MKKKIFIGSVIVGIILLIIGLYYLCIKAGIPYQDPPPELLKMYNKNMKIGEILILVGFLIECSNIIILVINFILKKLK